MQSRTARRAVPTTRPFFSPLFISLLCLIAASASAAPVPPDFSRADPATWDLWRCGPIPFPDHIDPQVPEAVANTALEFGRAGEDLTIVAPETADYDGKALHAMIRLIVGKVPRATVVRPDTVSDPVRRHHLLLLGTPESNALARDLAGPAVAATWPDYKPGGYRLWVADNPFASARKIIFALGRDPAGAWSAAAVLAYSIHPARDRLSPIKPWPVRLPDGIYWSPFSAESHGRDDTVPIAPTPAAPPLPRVPFGVRIWGSPMPTLGSYQRLIAVLRQLGADTVAVQSGGWPDLPDAPERFRRAVEIAAEQGVGTILYVGNDLVSHRPAPLTENHRAIVLATKDLPGLREFHVYNQLAADLTPAERALVEEQVRWLRALTTKRIGMEVVWGHDTATPPPEKVRLLTDLRSWGVDVIAHDDAPIGGWSRRHRIDIWEPRLRALAGLGVSTEAVLQAHIPFVDPTIPTPAELRGQFWSAVAGGARGFLFEAAYVFTSLSNRGLLGWDLRPLPDGRADEVRRLSHIAHAIEPFIADAQPISDSETKSWGVALAPDSTAVVRFYRTPANRRFLLLLNPSTTEAASARITGSTDAIKLRELAPGTALQATADRWSVQLSPGEGTCLEVISSPSPQVNSEELPGRLRACAQRNAFTFALPNCCAASAQPTAGFHWSATQPPRWVGGGFGITQEERS